MVSAQTKSLAPSTRSLESCTKMRARPTGLFAARTEVRTQQTKMLGPNTRVRTSSTALFARATGMLSLRIGTRSPAVAEGGDLLGGHAPLDGVKSRESEDSVHSSRAVSSHRDRGRDDCEPELQRRCNDQGVDRVGRAEASPS